MPISVKDLLEAGCHYGHQTKRWNPKMKDYVYGARNGISIIDLTKTINQIGDACNFIQKKVMNGARILFVGTKLQAQQIVKETAEATGMYYMAERWMGGTLTNIETIKKSVKKMQEIDAIVAGEDSGLKKKEISILSRQGAKLHKDLDGIADMKSLPDLIILIDVCHDDIAVREANKLGIPVVAIVDTNGNPELVDYPVAANDDAVKSIKVIFDTFTEAIKDASELYQAKVAERRAKEEAAKAERAAKAAEKAPRKAAAKPAAADDKKAAAPRKAAAKPAAADDKKVAAPRKKAVKEVKDLASLKKSDVAAKAE